MCALGRVRECVPVQYNHTVPARSRVEPTMGCLCPAGHKTEIPSPYEAVNQVRITAVPTCSSTLGACAHGTWFVLAPDHASNPQLHVAR